MDRYIVIELCSASLADFFDQKHPFKGAVPQPHAGLLQMGNSTGIVIFIGSRASGGDDEMR